MPQVQDYVSGNILTLIKRGFRLFHCLGIPIIGSVVMQYGAKVLKQCDAQKISADHAAALITNAQRCAVGQRICNVLYDGADHGKSVFLDELADGLVHAGKAAYVEKADALRTIVENRKGPIMITQVSGKHMEICRSIPKHCIYWNSEKHGLKCIKRNCSALGSDQIKSKKEFLFFFSKELHYLDNKELVFQRIRKS